MEINPSELVRQFVNSPNKKLHAARVAIRENNCSRGISGVFVM